MAENTDRLTIREAAASDLRQFFRSTVDAVNGAVITVDEMRDFSPDKYRIRDGYMWITSGEWRPVVEFDPSDGKVTLNRAYDTPPEVDDPIAWYGLLEPPSWDKAIDDALQATPHRELQEDSLVAGTYEYTMPTWVFSKDQVVQVRERYTPTGLAIREYPVPHLKRETANGVTIQIQRLPADLTNYKLVTELRRHYEVLATDDATTTCPLRLARAIVAEKAAERILHGLGTSGKEVFGVDMAIIREKADDARRALMNVAPQRDYQTGHTLPMGPVPVWSGPDWI